MRRAPPVLHCRLQAVSAADLVALAALTALVDTGGETKAEDIEPASVHEASTKAVGHRGLTGAYARVTPIAALESLCCVLAVMGYVGSRVLQRSARRNCA